MPEKKSNLPVPSVSTSRPEGQVRHRHDDLWEDQHRLNDLQKEQWDDQQEINEKNAAWRAKYEDELHRLRDAYMSDKRMMTIFWQLGRVGFRWSLYVAAALGGWAWNHWDKIESIWSGPNKRS